MGIAMASPEIIMFMNAIKPPYNVSTPTAYLACQAFQLESLRTKLQTIKEIKQERDRLKQLMLALPSVQSLRGGSDANFLLVQVAAPQGQDANTYASTLYRKLAELPHDNVVVRFRGNEPLCEGCIRVTVGLPVENDLLIKQWQHVVDLMVQQTQE